MTVSCGHPPKHTRSYEKGALCSKVHAAMFADRSEPRQDIHILAPLFLEVLAIELAALVDNQVLGFDLLKADNPVQSCRYLFGFRPRLEYGETHRTP